MAEIIKRIQVKDKEEAVLLTNLLTEKYRLVLTDPDNSLDVSNEKMHVYYDSDRKMIIIESNNAHSVAEYMKELAMDFPTFF